ncbi:hypothetical protein DRB06_14890 [Actinomyces sp. Z5]|nr:hypothetical protein DRB06_14890 [Actinomyces sp. Z5]
MDSDSAVTTPAASAEAAADADASAAAADSAASADAAASGSYVGIPKGLSSDSDEHATRGVQASSSASRPTTGLLRRGRDIRTWGRIIDDLLYRLTIVADANRSSRRHAGRTHNQSHTTSIRNPTPANTPRHTQTRISPDNNKPASCETDTPTT